MSFFALIYLFLRALTQEKERLRFPKIAYKRSKKKIKKEKKNTSSHCLLLSYFFVRALILSQTNQVIKI